MKKLGLFVSGIVLSTALFAQKPDATVHSSLEGQFGFNTATLTFDSPAIRYRYFLQNNLALRASLGIDNTCVTDNFFENEQNNTGATGTYQTKNNGWTFGIGGEYHFTGTNRLSPYAGADILLGAGKVSTDGQNSDGNNFVADYAEMAEQRTGTFGLNLVAGTDFYFAQNVYFGVELGLGWESYKVKEGESSVTFGGNTITLKTNEETTSAFGNNVVGSFRLGWRF